ncbi:MAG: type I restriction enzyme HsdR N-terminal domain-containing protein [Gemmatimonadetes bacterium]|nr:type I restriction enzyme HsdR N-terminal domain-containing protein [Gemmatimonadota bacterium]MDE0965940.1 type I restriction enzyme HsdR N-terminal domain-containing protein [Candidatus Latescibacterota bacterium]MBT5329158.1 type I restriction enzyme HsdR N-terminal domain-containing protein [Gemmatimonadota bacterium]MBT5450349.1 type I restriction enzyme HsdR N-terminal domain-containing protein [Gemmatimonadota bacterium]MBT5800628.1 type I restriction enzyme HsdR N-terminal domain-con
MQHLNFPSAYPFDIREVEGKRNILDPLRRKYVRLTPEEWVRQNLVQYLIVDLGYPRGLTSIEKGIDLHGKPFRADVIVHDRHGQAVLMAECKEPSVRISQDTFDQIAVYNRVVQARCLLVSNGLDHYCYAIDRDKEEYRFLDRVPRYEEL